MKITTTLIKKIVAGYFDLRPSDLDMKTRERWIVTPRQVAHYFCIEFKTDSQARIASEIGGRDHATALHSHKTIKDLIFSDNRMQKTIDDLKRIILNTQSDDSTNGYKSILNRKLSTHVSQKTLICNVSNVAPSSRRIKV